MPRAPRPWFRFYVEAISDRKLRRFDYKARWIWLAVLAAACDSPERGKLYVAEHVPMTTGELADFAGVRERDVTLALKGFSDLQMVTVDAAGLVTVTNWDARQYESDNVTTRTRAFRERSKERSNDVPGNGPETETETETEITTGGGDRCVPLHPADADGCAAHPQGTDQPCRGCARVRQQAEARAARAQDAALLAAERARANCPDCEGTGKVLDPDTKLPTRRTCTHPKTRPARRRRTA